MGIRHGWGVFFPRHPRRSTERGVGESKTESKRLHPEGVLEDPLVQLFFRM